MRNINEKWVGHLNYKDIEDIVYSNKECKISSKEFDRSHIELKYLNENYLFSNQMSFIEIEKEF